jgi:acetamidase/formamidase
MTIHTFTPSVFHTTLGWHAPVLRIADGDTVATTTADAGGRDQHGQVVAGWPNPQTGPFYVEGAEPGDTLAVHFDALWPNRDHGYTSARLAPHVVDAEFARSLPDRANIAWRIDRQAGRAWPEPPLAGLPGLSLPLAPMLGCFGVAPAGGQAISTATSGPHGGNMDYRGFTAGTTVYLPVAAPGGLFFLGDGHAVQGDGEIAGTGIEVSFDARFTVRVRKGWTIGWPRGEDADCLFTVGNARPLDQALQHATTEMARWLMADYGLDLPAIGVLLGQCVEYAVGNVYDPAYTMVCRLSKRWLPAWAG